MKKNHPLFTGIFLFMVVLLCAFGLSMCKGKKTGTNTTVMGNGSAPVFSMKSIILDSLTLKTWVANNWTKPNGIRLMIMQFISADASSANTNLMCLSYPAKKITQAGAKGSFLM
jgi:hypothetical protein